MLPPLLARTLVEVLLWKQVLVARWSKQLGRVAILVREGSFWRGSLEVTKKYPLKIADNQGGYIETNWIYTPGIEDQRCLIKIQVLSLFFPIG